MAGAMVLGIGISRPHTHNTHASSGMRESTLLSECKPPFIRFGPRLIK
jgi:hypothetical protein